MGDIVGAGLLLVLLAPLFAFVATLVWWTMGRPIFHVQERLGRDGRRFRLFKFRSIVADAEAVVRERADLWNRYVETDFKLGKINVLSATPTLEMGIDIGDLSSVLLCSVPPAQANYTQRIGRAGRRTGNAYLPTLATGRPHDLYFWAQPREMLAGDIDQCSMLVLYGRLWL